MMTIYLIVVGVISLITFILYGVDKAKAKAGSYRIPEKVLLLFSFFLGALGGTLGMYLFRHKTKHWYFVVVNIASLIIHVALAIVILIYAK